MEKTKINYRPPYGYKVSDGKLVSMPEEIRALKLIFTLALKKLSKRDIIAELNKRGIPSKTGKGWTTTNLNYVLNKIHFHAGKDEAKRLGIPAIISEETANKIAGFGYFLTKKKHRTPIKKYLLSNLNLFFCGFCGGPVKSSVAPKGKRFEYYKCTNSQTVGRSKCPGAKMIQQHIINDAVLTDLQIHINTNLVKNNKVYVRNLNSKISKEIASLESKINSLFLKQRNGIGSAGKLNDEIEKLMLERNNKLQQLEDVVPPDILKKVNGIKNKDMDIQRELLPKVIKRIALYNGKVVVEYKFGIDSKGNNIKELEIS